MPADPVDPADLVHDARNALAVALGRLQLLRRHAERGRADTARLLAGLGDAETRLRRVAALIDALEEAAEAESPTRPPARSAAA